MAKSKITKPIEEKIICVGRNISHTPFSNTGCGSSNYSSISDDIDIVNTSVGDETTPTTMPDYSICIDWFKIRIDHSFVPGDIYFDELLDALKVDKDKYDLTDKHWDGFKKCYVYGSGTKIMSGGNSTKNAYGEDITIIEMPGEECRVFELLRDGDWLKLLNTAVLQYKCTNKRIDLDLDDYTGFLTTSMLEDRFRKGYYTTPFRRRDVDLGLKGLGDIKKGSKGGWTLTLGGKSSRQLCIYNKAAERKEKGYTINVDDWIRYEQRWFNERGNEVLLSIINGLTSQNLPAITCCLLGAVLEFKADNHESISNMNRAPIYKPWEYLLNGAKKIKLQSQARLEMNISKVYSYGLKAFSKTDAKIFACHPEWFDEYFAHRIMSGVDKLTYSDFEKIKNQMILDGSKNIPESLAELRDTFINKFGEGQLTDPKLIKACEKTRIYVTPEQLVIDNEDPFNMKLSAQISNETRIKGVRNSRFVYYLRRRQSNGIIDYYEGGNAFFNNRENALPYSIQNIKVLKSLAKRLKNLYPHSVFELERKQ